MARRVFRKAALERLSSPEQLDQLIQVTHPQSWLLLLSLLAVLLAFVLWGLFGSVKTRVQGQGILLGGNVYDLAPLAAGQITRLTVGVGEMVTAGAVVAEVDQPDLAQQLTEARTRLREFQAEHRRLAAFGVQDIQLQMEVLARQRTNLEDLIQAHEERERPLAGQVEAEEGLLAQGLITRQQLLATRQRLATARSQIEQARTDLRQLASRELNAEFDLQQQRVLSEQRIRDAERLVAQLEEDYHLRTRVVSPHSGRVLEMLVDEGALVSPGVPILKLGLTGEATATLYAVLYVPTEDGKKVRAGMTVQVAPATVKPEEFGFMVGRITRVADFPATTQGMLHVLKNDQLARRLAALGAPFEVLAELEPDPATPSGYAWTSGHGPPVDIYGGTPVQARITVLAQRPLELVVPAIRKALSVY